MNAQTIRDGRARDAGFGRGASGFAFRLEAATSANSADLWPPSGPIFAENSNDAFGDLMFNDSATPARLIDVDRPGTPANSIAQSVSLARRGEVTYPGRAAERFSYAGT